MPRATTTKRQRLHLAAGGPARRGHRVVGEQRGRTAAGLDGARANWGDRIVLGLAIEGARTLASEPGLDATLMRPTGSPLHYSGLEAWDANGESLAARMVEAVDGLSIEIEAADAAFLVTVDPWRLLAVWLRTSQRLPRDVR